jgi:eight-cysteine-cluster-containing protein
MLRALIFSIALSGCARDGAPTQAVATTEGGTPVVALEPAADAAPAAAPTAAELYAQCQRRVEGREADGECSSDGDCSTAGCSQEVCVSKEMAPQVMSACEVKPCFAVLDTCGCAEGRCTWSLKEAPTLDLKVQLPPKEQAP